MSDASFNSFAAPDGNPESTRAEIADLIERFRLDGAMISADDLSLFLITDSVDETVADVAQFYRVFHSMQYVLDRLMFRLRRAPSEQQLAAINREFADVLTDGEFELHGVIPGEAADPELSALARLVFHFNRRNHGRLRRLVDWINVEVR